MKKLSKTEAKKQIEELFKDIKSKSPKDVRKIKKLAMSYNIPLKEKRKLFCKYCFSPNLKIIGIKNKIKKVQCENCGKIARWRINSS